MNNENEIERMAIEQVIRDEFIEWLNVAGCIPQGTTYWCECMGCIEDSAAKLVSAGIGDKKQAVKEAYDALLAVIFADAYHLPDVFIDDEWLSLYDLVRKRANTVITELYGADE